MIVRMMPFGMLFGYACPNNFYGFENKRARFIFRPIYRFSFSLGKGTESGWVGRSRGFGEVGSYGWHKALVKTTRPAWLNTMETNNVTTLVLSYFEKYRGSGVSPFFMGCSLYGMKSKSNWQKLLVYQMLFVNYLLFAFPVPPSVNHQSIKTRSSFV